MSAKISLRAARLAKVRPDVRACPCSNKVSVGACAHTLGASLTWPLVNGAMMEFTNLQVYFRESTSPL